MNEDTTKKESIAEKARVKTKFRKIMSDSKVEVKSNKEVERKSVVKEANNRSSSKRKRNERNTEDQQMNDGDVDVGSRVSVKFKDGIWFEFEMKEMRVRW